MDGAIENDLVHAITLFNKQGFFQCHEILEDIWFEVRGETRNFYQGILHISVGFLHLKDKNNLKGAVLQIRKVIFKLNDFIRLDLLIDIESLIEDSEMILSPVENNMGIPKEFSKIRRLNK